VEWAIITHNKLIEVVEDRYTGVCQVYRNNDGAAIEDRVALKRASFIAAAPDLLLACERQDLYERMKKEYYKQSDLGQSPSKGWQELGFVDLVKAERIARETRKDAIAKARCE
jgi:hypothetical protein